MSKTTIGTIFFPHKFKYETVQLMNKKVKNTSSFSVPCGS
ncbi:hypothetical protein LOK49_LG01G00760 [Camellia lanceoleosa]|uniref:Uncharacterized protein n=1 Tax=Camellia lanceoleosa TaxID=1840588 RepID=A0ACC0ITN1_9ERIC|nr:hypothetical protein LOK49_LG01G00760 [Camellia lanceoleosa]